MVRADEIIQDVRERKLMTVCGRLCQVSLLKQGKKVELAALVCHEASLWKERF